MSLFNTLELWSTKAGENESFGFHSLVVSKLDETEYDKIIIGSFDGILRIYQVVYDSSQQVLYKSSDLLIETQLSESISQVVVGKLVSGSKAIHIGIVQPRTISVYSFIETRGSVEHGSHFDMKLIYEHSLQHYNYQVVIGSFGGVKGRDFLCALAVDGTLSFFEQETFVYETQLPSFLLPFPISYIAETDVFITLTKDWCIVAYKYQDLVTAKKKVVATWSYSLGETLLDVQTARYGQQETYIITLSEHNVTCFNANGLLKFASRLQYAPVCFRTYFNEYNNSLMMMVVSDCGTVFIYESNTLRWSAKLPIIPLCILRANVGVDGALVLLSDEGHLKCCFLGTRPTLFVAPPLENSITQLRHVTSKLELIQNKICDFKKNNRNSLSVKEQEVSINFKFLPYNKLLNHCQLDLELKSSRPLSNIRIYFEVNQPVCVKPVSYTIPTLYERVTYNPVVEIDSHQDIIVSQTELKAIVCYMGTNGPRVIRKSAHIWSKFLLQTYVISNSDDEWSTKLSINTNKTPPSLLTLFQDLLNEQLIDDEIIGICLRYNPRIKCSISALKTPYGFNLNSNSTSMMCLMVSQLMQRCKKHDSLISLEYREKVPIKEMLQAMTDFVIARNKIDEHEILLEKLCAQYRLIQRRLFVKVKDKIPSNLSSLQALYGSAHNKLMDTIISLDSDEKNMLMNVSNLQAIIELTFELMLMKTECSKETVLKLKMAIDTSSMSSSSQDWGERTLANVTYFLKTSLLHSDQDHHRLIPPSDYRLTDPTELENVILDALKRILGDQLDDDILASVTSTRNDQQRVVSPIPELEENDDINTVSPSGLIVKHQKLLKKRVSRSFIEDQD